MRDITREEVKDTNASLNQVREIKEQYKNKVKYLERTEEKVIAKMSARMKTSKDKIEHSSKRKEEDAMRKMYI